MNNTLYENIFGHKKVRKTWKHTLSPEKNAERIKQMQFCKKVREALGEEFEVTFYFNPGGVAVWGETYVKIFSLTNTGIDANGGSLTIAKYPVVEACLSHDFSYIRQWDGQHSGHNYACRYKASTYKLNPNYDYLDDFLLKVRTLASKPFVRF